MFTFVLNADLGRQILTTYDLVKKMKNIQDLGCLGATMTWNARCTNFLYFPHYLDPHGVDVKDVDEQG